MQKYQYPRIVMRKWGVDKRKDEEAVFGKSML